MSVYSGFATRQQQTKYNTLLENLVIALKKRVIKFYRQEACNEDKFKLLVKKIYKKMFVLEKGKYLVPKYSTCYADLIAQLGIEIDYDNISDTSSLISQSFTVIGQRRDDNQVSTNINNQFLRSRSVLQSKKNSIQVALQRDRGSTDTFSLGRHNYLDSFENRDQQTQSRGSSLDADIRNKALMRLRLRELKDLEQLRGTSNFPKIQDYMPKPDELPKQYFESPVKKVQSKETKEFRSFRRHKFSRSDVEVEEL